MERRRVCRRIAIEAADLPGDVLALLDQYLLDLGGSYGDPQAGDPIQYDELRIEHDQGDVEIVIYDRTILLFMTDSETVRRIHQVCCWFEDISAGDTCGCRFAAAQPRPLPRWRFGCSGPVAVRRRPTG